MKLLKTTLRTLVTGFTFMTFMGGAAFADDTAEVKMLKREITQLLAQASMHGSMRAKKGLAKTELDNAKTKLEALKSQSDDHGFIKDQEDSIKDIEELLG